MLHYSSPHIVKFNERIWLNGSDVSDVLLEEAHVFLQSIYSSNLLKKLTYFEYTTLLALYLSKDVNYLVLEAGLGGEFDATNVVKSNLSLITTIDLDHQSFLGNTVKEIAITKMRSVDNKMIIGYQIHDSIINYAEVVKEQIRVEKNKEISIEMIKDFNEYKINNNFALYLRRNIYLCIAALKELRIDVNLEKFNDLEFFGRCQKIRENITIDVGHNPLAARVLLEEFKSKKVTLVYNSYADKDYKKVLKILKPIIKNVAILELDDKRVVNKNNLLEIIKDLNIINTNIDKIDKNEEYLVFGSFLVVEKFLTLIGFDEK